MISVYTANTPNGIKIPIALEEMDVPYELHRINLSAGEQKQEEFLKISPNGRIPAIVDTLAADGEALPVFESGAILLYLAERFSKLIPSDLAGRTSALEWLFFQVGGVGPMFGQSGFFRRNDEQVPIALQRYETESNRLSMVLNHRLEKTRFLAGDELSIADIANYGWVNVAENYAGVNMEQYPALKQWVENLRERPAFKRGHAALG